MPEILWKSYIDFEIEQQEYDRTRGLYDRLLAKTNHVKVWLSLAQFELTNPENAESSASAARSVYKRAYDALKLANSSNEARMMVLEAWKDFEVNIFTVLLLLVSKY
jgi:crooked neck